MGKCKYCEKKVQGKLYYDRRRKLWGFAAIEKYDKPYNMDVLVPFMCPVCGLVEWRVCEGDLDVSTLS